MYVCIYIYIYMCVCVCVCVCTKNSMKTRPFLTQPDSRVPLHNSGCQVDDTFALLVAMPITHHISCKHCYCSRSIWGYPGCAQCVAFRFVTRCCRWTMRLRCW